ncbi:transcription regulator HTH, apses-type DNA-binding domain-containing protein [Mucor mucedo]|uniref:transcription regulator HTH, apses-type DNA-binding domain-containing protein n=1 Tax=Mucor mucedo TaxID=29922 RepID=UPI00222055DA|nr:transcription regulator HTH, apses-type DNA-binding domain-containing protein [Mucor mucedo]KAI7876305.1 transcription regulator HTH, apses-type DNA-binding domain-containing protein [Mucor mucedo]
MMTDNKKNLTENDCLMYRPFGGGDIQIKRDHYSTSLDTRGYIPVYEYIINNTPIMWDRETGYVHFTGIWKALGNSKSDIVKMVDSNPELGTRKIRGGFLRIQGTWIPYDYAHLLCKRTAWHIRKELVPIFGQQFPLEALHPDHPDYGCLLLDPLTRKKSSLHKRNTMRQKPYTKPSTDNNSHPPRPKKSAVAAVVVTKRKIQHKNNNNNNNNNRVASSMSVTRLLNTSNEDSDILSSEEEDDDDTSSSFSSPSFRVIQTYPPEDWSSHWLLPPIHSPSPSPPTPSPPPPQSQVAPLATSTTTTAAAASPHIAQDIIDTISATILLQRLSQDDGKRPFKPFESTGIPSKVIVGHQEFSICWD